MNIFIDESGDLGFTFKAGGRGSSRFLTIACVAVPENKKAAPVRTVRKLYKKIGKSPRYELKGASLSSDQKVIFAQMAHKLLNRNPDINFWIITVNKARVQLHIRQDPNKLYNYMLKLLLLDRIKSYQKVTLHPDERSIKVKSGNSLVDYLQTELWFVHNAETVLRYFPLDSKNSKSLQFIDFISNITWNHYERGRSEAFRVIEPLVTSIPLFFP